MSPVPVIGCLSERLCLGSVQGTFPGNLQLVLVLRPSRFFQKAIADIGIKLHKDDFKMKVPVSLPGSKRRGGTAWGGGEAAGPSGTEAELRRRS